MFFKIFLDTLARKLFAFNFQKSPNLVTLLGTTTFNVSFNGQIVVHYCKN